MIHYVVNWSRNVKKFATQSVFLADAHFCFSRYQIYAAGYFSSILLSGSTMRRQQVQASLYHMSNSNFSCDDDG